MIIDARLYFIIESLLQNETKLVDELFILYYLQFPNESIETDLRFYIQHLSSISLEFWK